jgi:potassium/sodium efflux P-type ATPase
MAPLESFFNWNYMSEQTVLQSKPEYHRLSTSEVYTALGSRPEGLTQTEAQERLDKYGRNEIQRIKGKPLIVKFLSNFTHLMAILLWAAGIAALLAQMPQLAIAVWMVNVINGVFSFWQEFRAEKATEALRKLLPTYCRVMRDGSEQRLLAEELVPGDVVILGEGDKISADCRLIAQAELRTDQSTLTGESRPVSKSTDPVKQEGLTYTELPNLIFAGTHVAAGTAKAIVFASGMNTEFGKIAHLTQEVGEELSPLQKEMITATRIVTIIAVAVGLVFFFLAVFLAGVKLIEGFIFAVGMVVAFVPEGMLPLVTLALAMATQRMAKRHALIKKLSAVETLGCTTVICTDKTGTLTQNEMTVKSLWIPTVENKNLMGINLQVTGVGYAPDGEIRWNGRKVTAAQNKNLHQLLRGAGLCNNSRLLPPNGKDLEGEEKKEASRWTVLGDPTEAALLVVAREGEIDLEDEELFTPRLRELPFESRRKRMSTIHRDRQVRLASGDQRYQKNEIAYVKGAPREILELCTKIYIDGEEKPLDNNFLKTAMTANDEFARNGLRVLAVAQRKIPADIKEYTVETVEKDLVFLGLMAMMDPPRPEVTAAVEECGHAGIRVIMITGDYGLTAESIARRIGIVKGAHPRIITGLDLETMDDELLKEALKDEVIFARVAPEQKLKVVTALQELGNVVAVTGDGVNDSPALKKADIGVAMGISGSDVAKEAADMILTDDNFASIVNAVEEGRAVFSNIKKFCTYIFTSNTPEAFPFIIYVLSGARVPLALNVMHILSIDLGTDMIPALALGAEEPEPGVMDKPPRSLKEHVIDRQLLLRAYGYLGIVQGVIAMIAFYFWYWTQGYAGKWLDLPDKGPIYLGATAITLAVVVTTQIGNLFTQRTEKTSIFRFPFFKNPMIWIGIGSELVLILLIVYTPFMNKFIGTGPFPPIYWLFLFAWIPSLIVVDEIAKYFKRRKDKRSGGKL